MLKLELPFHLVARGAFLRNNFEEVHRPRANEVILEGLSISIAAGTKTYEVSSERPPGHDGPGSLPSGMLWSRCLWPLIGGISIEQQMMIPADGNAPAVSWNPPHLSAERAATPERNHFRYLLTA
ncbi:MAG: hypothetical protein ACREIF_15005 [Chthoniobacterales bacterium]